MKTDLDPKTESTEAKTPDGAELGARTGSTFSWRLKTTDGSEPLDLLEDEDGSMIYQGETVVGAGETLLQAWNDYLFPIGPGAAPVRDNDLHRMWSAYDKSNEDFLKGHIQ